MANYEYTISTEPMAEKMDDVRVSMEKVSYAVDEMREAIVSAEKAAAKKVSGNVTSGFYWLVRSQISQKIAGIGAVVNSKFMELSHQSAALKSIKSRMERDYMRKVSQYTRLFKSLNQVLRCRVFELDKFVAHLVTKDIQPTTTRVRTLVSAVPVSQSESIAISQSIASSRMKHVAQKLLMSLKLFLTESVKLNILLKSILINQEIVQIRPIYIPFVVTESTHIGNNSLGKEFVFPNAIDVKVRDTFTKGIQLGIDSTQGFEWENVPASVKEVVSKEFQALIQNESAAPGSLLSDRVKQNMRRLFEANSWQSVKGL